MTIFLMAFDFSLKHWSAPFCTFANWNTIDDFAHCLDMRYVLQMHTHILFLKIYQLEFHIFIKILLDFNFVLLDKHSQFCTFD